MCPKALCEGSARRSSKDRWPDLACGPDLVVPGAQDRLCLCVVGQLGARRSEQDPAGLLLRGLKHLPHGLLLLCDIDGGFAEGFERAVRERVRFRCGSAALGQHSVAHSYERRDLWPE